MKTYTFTNGKKEVKTYKEISNKDQGCYKKDELIRLFKTDSIEEHDSTYYETRFEEVKD
jgi:hypothetical protein